MPGDIVGQVIGGRYRILSHLGAGGMASVYLAQDENLDRKVVVKLPLPGLLRDESFLARFDLEIRSLIRLVHPHVVKVLDAGTHEGAPFFVMEHLEGGSLKARLDAVQKVEDPREILDWLPTVAAALDHVHEEGTLHRDVKPGNVLFDQKGNAFLSDFGIAKALDPDEEGLTRTGQSPGSPGYMAPEILGGEIGPAYDQYGLAAIVYRALTGAAPPPFITHPEVAKARGDEMALSVPSVVRGLAAEPGSRFPSCSAFAEAFARGIEREPAGSVAPPEGDETGPTRRVLELDDDEDTGLYDPRGTRTLNPRTSLTEHLAPTPASTPEAPGRRSVLPRVVLGALAIGVVVAALLLFWPSREGSDRTGPETARAGNDGLTGLRMGTAGPGARGDTGRSPTGMGTTDSGTTGAGTSGAGTSGTGTSGTGSSDTGTTGTGSTGTGSTGTGSTGTAPALPPARIELALPVETPLTRFREHEIEGQVVNPRGGKVVVGERETVPGADGRFTLVADLPEEGPNDLRVEYRDSTGALQDAKTYLVVRDTIPPDLGLDEIPRETAETTLTLSGSTGEPGVTVLAAEKVAKVSGDRFTVEVDLAPGVNTISILATDPAGNEEPKEVSVRQRPEVPYPEEVVTRFRAMVEREEWGPWEWERSDQGLLVAVHEKTGLLFALVPPGSFSRGSESAGADERPVRTVKIASFLLSATECTQKAWDQVGGRDDRSERGASLPIHRVSWAACKQWCEKAGLRLPSEAEWEFAARAGEESAWTSYLSDGDRLSRAAWWSGNSESRPHEVAGKAPSTWGFYDLLGNVGEWVLDRWHRNYARAPADESPWTIAGEKERVWRGGGYTLAMGDCRPTKRYRLDPDDTLAALGFRPAADLPVE